MRNTKEMEEVRTYFEKKCAYLEKNQRLQEQDTLAKIAALEKRIQNLGVECKTEKHVRFEDEDEIDKLRTVIEDNLRFLEQLDVKVGQLQDALKHTEDNLKKAMEASEEEHSKHEETIEEDEDALVTPEDIFKCIEEIKELKEKNNDFKNAKRLTLN